MKPLSRAAQMRQWWTRYMALKRDSEELITEDDWRLMREIQVEDLPLLIEVYDEDNREAQQQFLVEFANLQDDDGAVTRFKGRYPSVSTIPFPRKRKGNSNLLRTRDVLRVMWADSTETSSAVQAIAWGFPAAFPKDIDPSVKVQAGCLRYWFDSVPMNENTGWFGITPLGIERPQQNNFLGQLAWGICHNYSRFRVCKNPDCATPYYLWRRFDQQYCSSDGCVRYANRIAANKYWSEKGSQRRKRRGKE